MPILAFSYIILRLNVDIIGIFGIKHSTRLRRLIILNLIITGVNVMLNVDHY